MKKISDIQERRVRLGAISQTTLGGIRGVIEPFGLYTADMRLD
ncbi:MAG TPA: hypothetical protein VM308_08260 [Sphingomicrobium sp.]|nr:hypothetical protein [Sphingomicrobium sp.]